MVGWEKSGKRVGGGGVVIGGDVRGRIDGVGDEEGLGERRQTGEVDLLRGHAACILDRAGQAVAGGTVAYLSRRRLAGGELNRRRRALYGRDHHARYLRKDAIDGGGGGTGRRATPARGAM